LKHPSKLTPLPLQDRIESVGDVGDLDRPRVRLTCAKYSSGVPDALSTTSVRSREELEGLGNEVLMAI